PKKQAGNLPTTHEYCFGNGRAPTQTIRQEPFMTLTAPTKTTADFYVTGGTLPREASSYVTRQADADLFDSLLRGEFCYVLNSRQMGKSSLMVRTADRLKAEGVTVAVLDLTAVGQNLTPEQWYDGLLALLAEQLHLEDELEDFWLDNPKLGPLQ